jgi:hypothetical protein
MDRLPSLLETFKSSHLLEGQLLEWLDDSRRARILETLRLRVSGAAASLALEDSEFEQWNTTLSTLTIVALGPAARLRCHRPSPSFIVFDLTRPDSLFFLPGDLFPPSLWIDLKQDPARLLSAFAEYLPSENSPELSLTKSVRGFLGSEQDLEMDLDDFAQWLTLHPLTDNKGWGSIHESDPFEVEEPASKRSLPVVKADDDELDQADDAIPSVSFRTKYSRSIIRIEDHDDFFVIQAKYRPTDLSGRLSDKIPADVPADLAGILAHLAFDDEGAIRGYLQNATSPDDLPYLIFVLSLIKYSDLSLVNDLRHYANHDNSDVRIAVADIASRMDYDFLLQEMSVSEKDPELKRKLELSL